MPRAVKVVLIVVSIAAVLLLIAGLPFLPLISAGLRGALTPNAAERVAEPLENALEQAGGRRVCSDGDSGHGLVNRTPWHHVYYEIADSPDLADTVIDVAADLGYELAEPSAANRVYLQPTQELLPPGASLSIEDPELAVLIYRGQDAVSGCVAGTEPQAAEDGNAVVTVRVTLGEVDP